MRAVAAVAACAWWWALPAVAVGTAPSSARSNADPADAAQPVPGLSAVGGCRLRPLVEAGRIDPRGTLAALERAGIPKLARPLACLRAVEAGIRSDLGDDAGARAALDAALPALPELTDVLQARRAALDAPPAAVGPPAERIAQLQLLVGTPTAPRARALEALLDSSALVLTPGETAARAEALLRVARPHRALLECQRAHAPGATPADLLPMPAPDADTTALLVATTKAFVRAGEPQNAVAYSAAAVARASDAPPIPLLDIWAWALGKAERHVEAADVNARILQASADAAVRAEAAFFVGFSLFEGLHDDDAVAAWAAPTAVAAMEASPYEPVALWLRGLLAIDGHRFDEAVTLLDDHAARFGSDKESLKVAYWRGAARILAGDTRGGRAVLRDLAEREPLEYYGMLARRRVGLTPLQGALVPADAVALLAPQTPATDVTVLLYQLGFDDEARRRARTPLNSKLGVVLADVAVAQLIDDANFGWRRGGLFLPRVARGQRALPNVPAWRVPYAAPWPGAVDASASASHVDTSFVYAIMRTESGFQPDAVSVAGARGVIQLLPSVARGAARLRERPPEDAEHIFVPTVAIDLGAALLGAHQADFGSKLFAAAAYNAAAPNVVLWQQRHAQRRTRTTLPPLDGRTADALARHEVELFIELMPFKETRDYVKRVLATDAIYRALAGAPLTLDLPAQLPAIPSHITDFPNPD